MPWQASLGLEQRWLDMAVLRYRWFNLSLEMQTLGGYSLGGYSQGGYSLGGYIPQATRFAPADPNTRR